MIAAALLLAQAGPAVAPATLAAELNRARVELAAQRRQLDAQEARLRALEERLRTGPALAGPASAGPRGIGPGPTPPIAVAQASAASTPGDPATVVQAAPQPPLERVGQRAPGADRPPEVAVLGSEGSVVTRRGQLTGELQVDYALANRSQALFRGIEVVESVLVGEFNINESRQNIVTASAGLRYGLTDKLELGVRVPVVHRADNTVLVPVQGSTGNDAARDITTAATGTGLGDVEITARYQLATAHKGLPFLVGNLQVVAPTGSDPFAVPRLATGEATKAATGSGFWGVSPSLTAILPSDPAVLFATLGYTHNFGKDVDTVIPPVRISHVTPGDAVSFSAGIGIALNERTSFNLGYAQTWAFGTRTRTVLTQAQNGMTNDPIETRSRDLQLGRLLFGVTYRATDRASINWSVEVGATDDSPDVRSVLRLPLVLLSPR